MSKDLNICSNQVPKPIIYMIANMLPYKDLKSLCLTNDKFLKLFGDDNYWKSRIRSKLGAVPESAKVCEYKKWYINNINNVYYFQDKEHPIVYHLGCVGENPRILFKNVKFVNLVYFDPNVGELIIYIDSFGNLTYNRQCGRHFKLNVAKNVKKFVGDSHMLNNEKKSGFCCKYGTGLYYIDENDDLYVVLLINDKLHIPAIKLAQNVSFASIWDRKYEDGVSKVLYYISNNVLYEIYMAEYELKDSLFIIKDVKKVIHVTVTEETIIFIDTNNNLKITSKDDKHSLYVLVKGVKNSYIKKKPKNAFGEFSLQMYYIDLYNKLYKITNIEEYVGATQKTIKLKCEEIFENVKDYGYGYVLNYEHAQNFIYEHILTKNGNLYQRVGEDPFTLVCQNVYKIFENLCNSMLLFSVVV